MKEILLNIKTFLFGFSINIYCTRYVLWTFTIKQIHAHYSFIRVVDDWSGCGGDGNGCRDGVNVVIADRAEVVGNGKSGERAGNVVSR
jgi:hypothetical protein